MELVDDTGRPLTKSKDEIKNILQTVRPKNREQEILLARMIGEKIERERQAKLNEKIETGFNGVFKENTARKKDNDGFTPKRTMRLIAEIPQEMVYVAMQIWGPDVLKDKKLFKEAFVKDDTGRYCLTVDPKTI